MSTLAITESPTAPVAVQQQSPEAAKFELMQRQAKLFASSPLVPEHLRKNPNEGLANCYIALVLAEAMGENPLVVMQNIHFVKGKAGWSASYMIAKANASGIFKGVLRFKHAGAGNTRSCTAYATLADTGEVVEATVGMEMAIAEGWAANSKYKSMPDQMLIYRSATFLVRTYCPQVMLGYQTTEEIVDVQAALTARPGLSIEQVTAGGEVIEAESPPVVAKVEKPAEAKPKTNKLTEALDAFAAGGGQASWLLGEIGATVEDLESARGKEFDRLLKAMGDAIKSAG